MRIEFEDGQLKAAVAALSALAHPHRLAVFKLLMETGPDGLAAGLVAEHVGLPPSSMTFHLQQLHRARLLTQRRVGRRLIYAADFTTMNTLLAYLTENCCGRIVAFDDLACRPGATIRAPSRRTA